MPPKMGNLFCCCLRNSKQEILESIEREERHKRWKEEEQKEIALAKTFNSDQFKVQCFRVMKLREYTEVHLSAGNLTLEFYLKRSQQIGVATYENRFSFRYRRDGRPWESKSQNYTLRALFCQEDCIDNEMKEEFHNVCKRLKERYGDFYPSIRECLNLLMFNRLRIPYASQ